jgi:proteasome accessory factor B
LGRDLEVHPRTIRRDIEYLRNQGSPIEFDSRRNGYFYSEPSYQLPLVQLTEGELVALFLAEQLLLQYRGTPYGQDLEHAFAKITAGLDEHISVDAQRLSEAISFRTPAPAVFDLAIIKTLINAIVQRKRIVIGYWTASRDMESCRDIDPYHLMSSEGQYYLIAFCHLREEVRQFVPSRIRSIEVTDTTFEIPDTFKIDDYFASALAVFRTDAKSCHHVRLRFTGVAVRYICERRFHPSQTLNTLPNGDVILTMEVTHFREVERLVLSWLPFCEALEPPELRDSIGVAVTEGARMHSVSND